MRLLLLLVVLAGCASSPRVPPPGPGEIVSASDAQTGLLIGRSTKADVRAALGKATEIPFDSGYEVWVYRQQLREKEKPPRKELVLLFTPSGILSKSRLR
ncbi:MAG TPA: hypothetical protein VG873_01140 [Burkholderiales bacterium]|nr:hypothetical protein [Burkholderiales bacterium]